MGPQRTISEYFAVIISVVQCEIVVFILEICLMSIG
jgi:hypothetical protein